MVLIEDAEGQDLVPALGLEARRPSCKPHNEDGKGSLGNLWTERPRLSSFTGERPRISSFSGDRSRVPSGGNNEIRSRVPSGEMRSRIPSISMRTYKPHLITERRRRVEDLCRDLIVNNDHIHVMEMRLRAALAKGLSKETHESSSVKCFPTHVTHLPTGREIGQFLALDLGGTNFRVLLLELGSSHQFSMESEIFAIDSELMVGPGHDLFDYIATCLHTFMEGHQLEGTSLPLGFTFSFPLIQEGLATGRLAHWTKGFKCSDVEGEDVVDLLKQAVKRRGLDIEVVAILNDTTGCLMSTAWREPKCRIGLILGTGTNACYLEDVQEVTTVELDGESRSQHMVVNTEWGAFGDNGELDYVKTKWDEEVDAMSLNPGQQTFEKMISGMYMGELVRLVVEDMVEEGLMFPGQDTTILRTAGSFPTSFLSQIEADGVGEFHRCQEVLAKLGIFGASEADTSALRYICECVSRRAGFMCAAGITALLKKMDYREVVVAVDGSLFRHHPHFHNVLKSRVAQLMGSSYKFDLTLSEDGSGRGAALVAAAMSAQSSTWPWPWPASSCAIM